MIEEKIGLRKAIIEHLKTRKKYNELKNDYDGAIDLIVERTSERDACERDFRKCKAKFDKRVDLLLDENIELKRKLKELRSKMREMKNETNK